MTHPWETEGDLPWEDDAPEWDEPAPGEDPLYDLFKRAAEEEEGS